MDSGSGTTVMSEELVETMRRQSGMVQTALTQAFVEHARVVTSLGQECDITRKKRRLKNDIFQVIVISGKKTVREVSTTTKENSQPRSLFRLPVHGGAGKQSDSR